MDWVYEQNLYKSSQIIKSVEEDGTPLYTTVSTSGRLYLYEHFLDTNKVIEHNMHELDNQKSGIDLSQNSYDQFFVVSEAHDSIPNRRLMYVVQPMQVVAQFESTQSMSMLGQYTWVSRPESTKRSFWVATSYLALGDFYYIALFKMVRPKEEDSKFKRYVLELWQDKVAMIRLNDLKSVSFVNGHL